MCRLPGHEDLLYRHGLYEVYVWRRRRMTMVMKRRKKWAWCCMCVCMELIKAREDEGVDALLSLIVKLE